jgi:MerR family transcriptional regulator, thiopeptide resistance regulator
MRFEALKVGELAKRTGLTIRTLHHYDEIGLLKPSLHTESGHRLYTAGDIARLQQVISLRQLGFSLEEVGACLQREDFSPLEVIQLHIQRLREQIDFQRKLCERLETLAEHFRSSRGTRGAEEVSADEFLKTIEVMTMVENYYTPQQLEYLKKRREQLGDDAVKEGQAGWAQLYDDYRAEMKKGTDPADPKFKEFKKRQEDLIAAFTGGDQGIEQSLNRLWKEQGDKLSSQFGYEPELMEYMAKVAAAQK